MTTDDWKFYQSMSFCERHISPRPITSSLTIGKSNDLQVNDVTPPADQFARKKKAKIDEIDSQLVTTNKLVNFTLERINGLIKEEAEQSKKQLSEAKTEGKNAYLEAVIETLKTVPNLHLIACSVMILQEIEIIKQQT